jgi:hypothetical protein
LRYFLVLIHPVAGAGEPADHEPHVDSLVARKLVLLGGDLEPRAHGADAADVLHCGTAAEARRLAAEDPLFSSGYATAEVVEWKLVGVNPDAIEPSLVLRPSDIRS